MGIGQWILYGGIVLIAIVVVVLIATLAGSFSKPPKAVGRRDEQMGLFPFGNFKGDKK